MAETFSDIRIVDLDEELSGSSGEGALMRFVLRLSTSAPDDWSNRFNVIWKQDFYMRKHSAEVFEDRLVVTCMTADFGDEVLQELKSLVAETNSFYRQILLAKELREQARIATEKRDREEIANLKGKLKFD